MLPEHLSCQPLDFRSRPSSGMAAIFSSVRSSQRRAGNAHPGGRGQRTTPVRRHDQVDVDVVIRRGHDTLREDL